MKNLNNKFVTLGLIIITASIVIVACSKSSSSSTSVPAQKKALSVYLTDDPSQFSSVFIDIKTVEVKIDEDLNHDSHFADNDRDEDDDLKDHDQYGKWDTLSIRTGVYDIMKFRNGLDTLLAKGNIPVGRIGKIRLTLGTNNSVIVSNVSYPLSLTPGKNNYVYVKIEENDLDETPSGQIGLWIDFDLAASIEESNGAFYLNPTIKAFGMEKFGRIQGKVLPQDAHAIVKAFIGTDATNAIPDDGGGDFKIRGLKEGSYSVLYKGYNGYKDTMLVNVQVMKGKETELPKITLHK